mgnify:CR=1 FL=1
MTKVRLYKRTYPSGKIGYSIDFRDNKGIRQRMVIGPDKKVAEKVAKNPEVDSGILLCRSAQGMAMAANKFKNVRAVIVNNVAEAKLSRDCH